MYRKIIIKYGDKCSNFTIYNYVQYNINFI